ncbi:MAG: Holliday junction resolvase RuvX [Planctomycetota bacterium]
MKRILGIDWGARWIGLAVSDPTGTIASPLERLEVTSPEDAVMAVIDECVRQEVGAVVVGIPYNMNGTLGESGTKAMRFAELLEEKSGLPTHKWDERLTSVQAQQVLIKSGMSRKKRKTKVDIMAARFILQSFLDAQGSGD